MKHPDQPHFERMTRRSERLREIAHWPEATADDREALYAAADLYQARAEMMQRRMAG